MEGNVSVCVAPITKATTIRNDNGDLMPPKKKPAKKKAKKLVMPKVEFMAYFPGIQSEFRTMPEGGARIILEMEPNEALKMYQFHSIVARVQGHVAVTMELLKEGTVGGKE